MYTYPPSITTRKRQWMIFASFLLIIAIVVASGGAYYAILKNEQMITKNKIEDLRCELATYKMETSQLQAKAQEQTNRWSLLDRLALEKSELRAIRPEQVESRHSVSQRALSQLK